MSTTHDTETEARKSFQEQLEELRVGVVRLAGLVSEAIAGGTQALLDGDLGAAERVIAQDAEIDELAYAIEDECYVLLARQQPMASDLRTVLGVLRIGHELERSGDLMKSVVKATRRLYPQAIDPKLRPVCGL